MKKWIGLIFVTMLFTACSQDITQEPFDGGREHIQPEKVTVANGMLVFADSKALYGYINDPTTSLLNENFTSQKDLFNRLVDAEWQWYEQHKDSLNAENHSPLYHQYLKEGLIRELFYTDGTQSYAPNLSEPYYNKVVNKDGFFAVGDTICQVTPELLKKWVKGDIRNTDFLNRQKQTDENCGIYVTNSKDNELNTRAIFPIPNLLTISTGMYCSFPGNARTTVFVKDAIQIVNPNSYNRTFFFQVSHQVLNGSILYFVSKNYNLDVAFKFVDKNAPTIPLDPLSVNQDCIGSCDYFYVWAPYMVVPGQDVVNYTDTYYYLYHFGFFIKDRDITDPSRFVNRYAFYGIRENYASGSIVYDWGATISDMDNYKWISEMPH